MRRSATVPAIVRFGPADRRRSDITLAASADKDAELTVRPRDRARVVPTKVAIAPASSERTSATTVSSDSGPSLRTKAPPETAVSLDHATRCWLSVPA